MANLAPGSKLRLDLAPYNGTELSMAHPHYVNSPKNMDRFKTIPHTQAKPFVAS